MCILWLLVKAVAGGASDGCGKYHELFQRALTANKGTRCQIKILNIFVNI